MIVNVHVHLIESKHNLIELIGMTICTEINSATFCV